VQAVSDPDDPGPDNTVATANVVRRAPGATFEYSQNGPSALIPRSHCRKSSSYPPSDVTATSSWDVAGPRLVATILNVMTLPELA
jgi:hypothetical protein